MDSTLRIQIQAQSRDAIQHLKAVRAELRILEREAQRTHRSVNKISGVVSRAASAAVRAQSAATTATKATTAATEKQASAVAKSAAVQQQAGQITQAQMSRILPLYQRGTAAAAAAAAATQAKAAASTRSAAATAQEAAAAEFMASREAKLVMTKRALIAAHIRHKVQAINVQQTTERLGASLRRAAAAFRSAAAATTSYVAGLAQANIAQALHIRTLNALPNKMIAWGKSVQWVGRVMETRITLPLALMAAGASYLGFTFDRVMTRIRKVYGTLSTPVSKVNRDMELLQEGILLVSDYTGIAAEQVGEMAAAWAQAGAEGAALGELTQLSAEMVLLGELEPEETVRGLMTVMQAYQLSVDELKVAMAALNVVENETAAGLGDLIEGMEQAGAVALNAGVTVNELAGFIASLTPSGGSASEVGNALKSLIPRIEAPTRAAAEAFRQLGINVTDVEWRSLTFTEKIAQLADGYKDLEQAQKEQFTRDVGQLRQGNRLLLLLEDQISAQSRYNKVIEQTGNLDDAMASFNAELKEILTSDSRGLTIMWTRIKNQLIRVIWDALPSIVGALQMIERAFAWFAQLDKSVQRTVVAFGLFLMLLGPIIGYLGTFLQMFGAIGKLVPITVGVLTGALKGVLLVIGGLATGVIKIAGPVTWVIGLITKGLLGVGFIAKMVFVGLVKAGVGAFAALGGSVLAVVAIFAAVAAAVYLLVDNFRDLPVQIQEVLLSVVDLFRVAWEGVVRITSQAFNMLPEAVQKPLIALVRIVRSAVMAVYELLSYLNPFARHSPSVVDEVERGTKKIAEDYQNLARKLGVGMNVPILGIFSEHIGDGPRVPAFASGGKLPVEQVGGGMKVNKVTAIVGEGSRQFEEYVIPTDPKYRSEAKKYLAAAAARIGFAAGGVLPGATRAADVLRDALSEVTSQVEAQERQELIDIAVELAVDTGPVTDAIDHLQELDRMLADIDAQLVDQERVVENWKQQVDDANRTLNEAERQLRRYSDAVSDLESDLDAARSRLADWLDTPIEGTYAFADALFENEHAQNVVRLELLRLEETFDAAGWTIQEVRNWIEDNSHAMAEATNAASGLADAFDVTGMSADDIKKKINRLSGEITGLRGQENDLRLAGAGSDVLAGVRAQISAAEDARRTLNDSIGDTGGKGAPPQFLIDAIQQVDELEERLSDLGRSGEILQLEEAVTLEPLRYEIEATQRVAEQSFQAIIDGITAEMAVIASLETQLESARAAMEAQQTVVDQLTEARDALEASYDSEILKLEELQAQYDRLSSAAEELRTQLDLLRSAHTDLIGAGAGAGAGGVGGLGAGDFPTGAGLGDISDLAQSAETLEEWIAGIQEAMDLNVGDWDLAGDIQKELDRIKKEFEDFDLSFPGLGDAWDRFVKSLKALDLPSLPDFKFPTIPPPPGLDSWKKLFKILADGFNFAADWEGMADAVGSFVESMGQGLGPLIDSLGELYEASKPLLKLVGILAMLAGGAILGGLALLIRAFNELAQVVVRAAGWILEMLAKLLAWIIDTFVTNIVRVLSGLADMIMGFFHLDLNQIMKGWNAVKDAIDQFRRDVENGLVEFASDIAGALVGAGEAVFRGFWDGMVQMWNAIVGWLRGLLGQIINIKGPPSADRQVLVENGKAVMEGLWTGMRAVWDAIVGWLSGLLGKVLNLLANAPGLLISTGTSLLSGFFSGVTAGAQQVWTWFGALGSKILGYLTMIPGLLVNTGTSLISGFYNGVTTGAQQVWTWFSGLGSKITGYLVTFGSLLVSKGTGLITGLYSGITTGAQQVWTWFSGLMTKVTGYFVTGGTWLSSKGTAIITGFKTGITTAWTSVSAWFSGLKTKILNRIGETGQSLAAKGKSLIIGFKVAASTQFINMMTWVRSIPQKIKDGIGDLSTKLKYAGGQLLTGLWNGINDKVQWVIDKVVGVGGRIVRGAKDALGIASPSKEFEEIGSQVANGIVSGVRSGLIIFSPSREFMDIGENMMAGLGIGLNRSYPAIQKQIAGITKDITASFNTNPRVDVLNSSSYASNPRTYVINGDLSFPNMRDNSSVESWLVELEALAE